jgi:hypothetical protein
MDKYIAELERTIVEEMHGIVPNANTPELVVLATM